MKTNAIISALCVVGIIGALCSNGEEQRSVVDMKGPGKTDDPASEQNEGLTALPVQKVVYWSDIPGMKWDWGTQVTNAPSIPSASSFVQKSGDTMTGNLTIDSGDSGSHIKIMNSDSPNGAYNKLTAYGIIHGTDYASFTLQLPTKAGTLALTSDIPSTNGLAAKSYVDSHQWTWASITNKPNVVTSEADPKFNSWISTNGLSWDFTGNTLNIYGYDDIVYHLPFAPSRNGDYVLTTSDIRDMPSKTWVNNHKWDWGTQITNAPTFVTQSVTNGLAPKAYVDSHKWDWSTQVTNSPFALHTTGFPYVETSIGFAATDSGQGYAVPSSASFAGAKVHGIVSLGAGDGIITNCYGGIGLGMGFKVTNDVAFVWSVRSYNAAVKYGSHGMSTFNVDPHDGPAGFWIGETNLATYLANAGSREHTHSNLVNGTTEVIANNDGTASVLVSSTVQKANCVKVIKGNLTLYFKHTSAELDTWGQTWPDQLEFIVEYNGVKYDAVTVGETDEEDGRYVSTTLALLDGAWIWPSKINSPTYWDGVVIYDGGKIIGDGNGETCEHYTYTEQSSTRSTIATVDQLPSIPSNVSAFNNDAGYVDAQTATNVVTGVVPAWARSNKKPTYSYSEIQNRPNSIGGFVVITNIVDGEVVGAAMVYPEHEQSGIFVAPFGGIELSAEHDDDLGWFVGIGLSQTNDFASKAWVRSQEYVPASTATNIAKQIIRNAVSGVNTNIQSAEDARAALTNLITILKNL